jgi:hypothetical protein
MRGLFWLVFIIALGGPLFAGLFAILASLRLLKETHGQIHVIPSDSVIESPSDIRIEVS